MLFVYHVPDSPRVPESHVPESHDPESYDPESHDPESHDPESHDPVTLLVTVLFLPVTQRFSLRVVLHKKH